MSTFFTLLLFGAAIAFYLLPMIIAAVRNSKHSGAIFFVNMLFGWTVLGWIAALIWAIVEAPEEPVKAKTIDQHWVDAEALRQTPLPAQTVAEAIIEKADRLNH